MSPMVWRFLILATTRCSAALPTHASTAMNSASIRISPFRVVKPSSPSFKGQVAVYGTWTVFAGIFNEKRSRLVMQAGRDPSEKGNLTPRRDLLNRGRQSFSRGPSSSKSRATISVRYFLSHPADPPSLRSESFLRRKPWNSLEPLAMYSPTISAKAFPSHDGVPLGPLWPLVVSFFELFVGGKAKIRDRSPAL